MGPADPGKANGSAGGAALPRSAYDELRRLARDPSAPLGDRARLPVLAASAMRRILVEHARRRDAAKRGGGRRQAPGDEPEAPGPDGYLLELDVALERLARRDPELARLVELRFFGGLSVAETAALTGVSARTVKRGWRVARGWLHREITGEGAGGR